MNHLTDEQFEDILRGADTGLEHLRQCPPCQNRLDEKRAIARKLQKAFRSVRPGPALENRIRLQLASGTAARKAAQSARYAGSRSLRHRIWPALAAAAAILVIAIPLSLYFGAPSQAQAAQAQLVRIHEHNLSPNHEFFQESEPQKLAAYFKDKLGFNPRLPTPGRGLALRGCCVRHFRGSIVGSYVVDTPAGVMSIVVVTDTPESLGITGKFARGPYTYWKSSFAKCDMVSVRIGGYTYCAVGEISHEYLTELLTRLLPGERE